MCVADINQEGIASVAEEIRAAGGSATHFSLDVTSEEQAKAAVAHVVAEFGEINLLLNNAGVNKPTIFPNTPKDNYDFIMGVNAWGKFNVMKWAAQQMIDQGTRDYVYKIINVGSILSREAFLDVIPYSMSKHAVLGLIKGGAKALVGHNITVNGYGLVSSVPNCGSNSIRIWSRSACSKEGESMDSLAEDMILMKRYSYPEDVLGTASFLASSDSDYMTGQLIMIDGGMVLH